MTSEEIVERLEQLERENRRLKLAGIAALLAISSIMLVAAVRPVPQKLTTHELDVLDSSGRVTVSINDHVVNILDQQSGFPRIAIGDVTPGVAGIWLFEGKGSGRVRVEIPTGSGSQIAFFDAEGIPRATMALANSDPTIRLSDPKGFEMTLGNSSTTTPTTGATQQNSAASIVMGDKEHRVIWQAP